jgi:hypothetical protein
MGAAKLGQWIYHRVCERRILVWLTGLGVTLGLALATSLLVLAASDAQGQAAVLNQASTLGQWSAPQDWPQEAIHSHLLPTGKVMFVGGYAGSAQWDPVANTLSSMAQPAYRIFCMGAAFLSDGRLLTAGGHIDSYVGLNQASIYNPFNDTWTALPNMNDARWYPTNTALANGDMLVISGNTTGETAFNPLPQVWQAGSPGGWRNLSSALRTLPIYPYMYLAPNGMVFDAGPNRDTGYLNTTGAGAWTTSGLGNSGFSNFGARDTGTSVMYQPGRILLVGGADPPTASAEVIDLNSSPATWQYVPSMARPRSQHNATVLPDGQVLVTGGSSGPGWDNAAYPVYAAEMWNPTTGAWTTMASNSQYRGYHSTALLLPDARVLSAGGDYYQTAEVYSPPYLFRGARPTISAAPTTISYGQTFAVGTPDAANIAQVTWLRLGAVTHQVNMDQRFTQLSFSASGGSLNVVGPANPNLSPPGYYMLFILNGNGVPSVASIVQLQQGAVPPTNTPTTTAATPTPPRTATPGVGPSLSVSPTTVPPGGTVTAMWGNIPSPTASDWIGLYTPGSPNTSYSAWIYVSCTQTATTARASGSCAFPIPASVASGMYELRLLSQNGFTALATSGPFTVTPTATRTATPAGATPTATRTATPAGATPTATRTATPAGATPTPPRTATPGVGPSLSVSPTTVPPGGTVTAMWGNIPSPTASDWIGLYTPGSPNTSYSAWIYVSCTQTATTARASGSCAFPIPASVASGMYELRLLSQNGFTALATSGPFTVTTAGAPQFAPPPAVWTATPGAGASPASAPRP